MTDQTKDAALVFIGVIIGLAIGYVAINWISDAVELLEAMP